MGRDIVPLSEFGPDDNLNDRADIEWVNKKWARWILRSCALISMVSVSMNTPATFLKYPELEHVTVLVDLVIGIIFFVEAVAKIRVRGFLKGESPYVKNRWCIFDLCMLICIWISIVLQSFVILKSGKKDVTYMSILRSPRPLILIRVFRVFLRFQLPKTRIKTILQRSSNQIYNVTIFFLFFMALYGILGVQLFGVLRYHCVRKGVSQSYISINSLAIPDTYCSVDEHSGHHCPLNMNCIPMQLSKYDRGFNGFDDLATSFFTVYQSASQEGWVFLMYRAVDSLPSYWAIVYFFTLIFFLAWLGKNVFIAVIIETFAEIRVQFQQMWGSNRAAFDADSSQVIQQDGSTWKMVTMDESEQRGTAPPPFQKILKSTAFHTVILFLVLVNATVTATMQFDPHASQNLNLHVHYYAEAAFTVLFCLEAVFKMWCLGFKRYWKRSLHKFELILVIGTSLHIIPIFYRSYAPFTYFQQMLQKAARLNVL